MNNLIKIQNGFVMNNIRYLFEQFQTIGSEDPQLVSYQIVSSSQSFVGTDRGIILLDLTFTIDDVAYNNIDEFITQLFK